ncbi:MAG: SLBB domain-containing protein [Thermogutta sp.]
MGNTFLSWRLKRCLSEGVFACGGKAIRPRLFPRETSRCLAFIIALLMIGVFGCGGRNVYWATRLPLEYQAPLVEDLREIPLYEFAARQNPSDVIAPGDVLEVTISFDLATTVTPVICRVDDQGLIVIPDIGPIAVGGLRLSDAEKRVGEVAIARDVYRRPLVTIVPKERRTYQVTVTGAVEHPGIYSIPASQASLLTALVKAGGLKKEAQPTVEIRRGEKVERTPLPFETPRTDEGVEGRLTSWEESATGGNIVRIDLISDARSTTSDLLYQLNDGDVVHVPERKIDPIFVDGLVTKPGMYEIPPNQEVRLLDALAMAGGRNNPLADDVWILRHVPGREEPIVIKCKLNSIKRNSAENIRIAPGDVVTVEETPGTFLYGLLKGFVHLGGSIPLN